MYKISEFQENYFLQNRNLLKKVKNKWFFIRKKLFREKERERIYPKFHKEQKFYIKFQKFCKIQLFIKSIRLPKETSTAFSLKYNRKNRLSRQQTYEKNSVKIKLPQS